MQLPDRPVVGRLRQGEKPEGDCMPEEIQTLDRHYKDWRGVVVHVVGYDRAGDRVIFLREQQGYKPECAQPVELFKSRFERVIDEPVITIAPDSSDS